VLGELVCTVVREFVCEGRRADRERHERSGYREVSRVKAGEGVREGWHSQRQVCMNGEWYVGQQLVVTETTKTQNKNNRMINLLT
jgi:hypothetical protein